jgi:hypothetical protein
MRFSQFAYQRADAGYDKLIAVARERLRRPWESGALDFPTIKEALGDKAPSAQNALLLNDQIGPILASGAKGNPRQIKRFLNSFLLRQRTAEARGFGADVHLPLLAKLMLAERFIPRLFDQIAYAAAAAAIADEAASGRLLQPLAERLLNLGSIRKLPPPLPGTTRWDRKAIDRALDALSGLQTDDREISALDDWKKTRARRSERYS